MVRYEYIRRLGYYCTESSEHNAEYNPFFIKQRYPELIEQYNKCLCGECVEQVGLINKQIEIVEKIVDEYVSCNNLNLSPCFIENVKTRVKNFLLEYRDNPNRYYVFYWSEYPMGAIHNKVLIKIDSIWHIVQDDYDKKPSEKRTPFPEINDENLVTYLVKFIIEEGR